MASRRDSLAAVVASCVVISAAAAIAELSMGRSWFGPDGRFGFWEGNIWSSEQSQRLADPYSLTHVVHGFLFYACLALVARRIPVRWRLVAAVALNILMLVHPVEAVRVWQSAGHR